MRIRTDGDFAHRKDRVETLSDFYGINKTRALMFASDDIKRLVGEIVSLLEDEELSTAERRKILERVNSASPRFEFDFRAGRDGVDAEVEIDP